MGAAFAKNLSTDAVVSYMQSSNSRDLIMEATSSALHPVEYGPITVSTPPSAQLNPNDLPTASSSRRLDLVSMSINNSHSAQHRSLVGVAFLAIGCALIVAVLAFTIQSMRQHAPTVEPKAASPRPDV